MQKRLLNLRNNDKYLTSTLGIIMKITEFNNNTAASSKKALKEHFNTSFNVDKLGLFETKNMLAKVRSLLKEQRLSSVGQEKSPAYMKLVFMEQSLTHHYGDLKSLPLYNPRIVVENEEVEKSQVVLAAQEMVDSIQKMVEDVSDMLVKELPAVTDGVNSEFGTSEGEQFNAQVSGALAGLQATLTQTKTGLQAALGTITGQGGGFDTSAGADMDADGLGADMDAGADDMTSAASMDDGADDMAELGSLEEPEEEPAGAIGRTKR